MYVIHHTARLAPSNAPWEGSSAAAIGFTYAAPGRAKAMMFIARMPSSATPRSVSTLDTRRPGSTGPMGDGVAAGAVGAGMRGLQPITPGIAAALPRLRPWL